MLKWIPYLPTEVVEIIFEKILEDIYIRQYFGIYNKIDITKYEFLNKITRKNINKSYKERWKRYTLKKLYELDDRSEMAVNDDLIDVIINITTSGVKYDFNLYRLKLRKRKSKYFSQGRS
jgi:hypothetical protein